MSKILISLILSCTPLSAAEVHFSPAENLEQLDVAQIASAQRSIDMAAYVLTDWPVIDMLTSDADRGIKVRLYLDGGQAGQAHMEPDASTPMGRLLMEPNITVKQKHPGKPIMHLKAYCVDGHLLRSGSANFSASGLKHQDNDLWFFDDQKLCGEFTRNFDEIWSGKDAE